MIPTHETYMQRCLDLARNGLGATAPNPLVGAVIVHSGKIIGEGFHTGFGQPHAEVEAVKQVHDKSILPGSTLYVNLEPCNHQGKTPPCTDMILAMGIGKVVIAQTDPNPTAAGGIKKLRDNGVEVITGVLEKESRQLNCRFNTFHEKKRPYLILKWAQTGDGFVDSLRDKPDNQQAAWITDETCRRLVHKWRSEEQAILAGSRTILLDNPNLNTRSWSGKNPLRITIDRKGILPYHQPDKLHLLNRKIPTVIFTCTTQTDNQNLEFVSIPSGEPVWPIILSDLHNKGIQSVLVEGGPKLFESLIREDLWDEARVFIGPGWFGEGIRAPHFPYEPIEQDLIGNSQLLKFLHSDKKTKG